MTLEQWAIKWGVPFQAVHELKGMWGEVQTLPDDLNVAGVSEGAVQNAVRLEASRKGARLFRNNVGALKDERGRWLRYGLCNDSKKMNEQIKSHDLIGIKPVLITQSHVGTVIGQFLSREVKEGGWTYSGTPREIAQGTFGKLITGLGGDASFASGIGTI